MQDQRPGGSLENEAIVTRNQAIELLRIVSAYAIIGYHSNYSGHNVFYTGLVVFAILSPMLDAGVNWYRPRSAAMLAKALLLPWAFWMLFYGLLSVPRHQPIVGMEHGVVRGVLMGTAGHLWFLPYLWVVLVTLNAVKRRVAPRTVFFVTLAGATGLLLTVSWWRPWSIAIDSPFTQFIHVTPMVLVGIAYGVSRSLRTHLLWLLPLGVALAYVASLGLEGVSLPYALGAGLVVIADIMGRRLPRRWTVESVSRCMMGVYLSHIFWLLCVGRVSSPVGYGGITVTFLLALGSVWAARRYLPVTRRIT